MTSAILSTTWIFLKEQLREPTALAWTIFSPAVFFHALNYTQTPERFTDYLTISAWLYNYIILSSALLGMALYAVGRRESGFLRCFAATGWAKTTFMIAHVICHLILTIVYVTLFYLLTRPPQLYAFTEWAWIGSNSLVLYMAFGAIGMLTSSFLPIRFSTASTLFSALSFALLMLGLISNNPNSSLSDLPLAKPHLLIIMDGWQQHMLITGMCLTLFMLTLSIACRFLRIMPIWSRYA